MNERVGSKGALLDEYEKAILELQSVIAEISPKKLTYPVDRKTTDANCISVQTILAHVISSGYSYANYIRKLQHAAFIQKDKVIRNSINEYNQDFSEMFLYTIETFNHFS